MTHFGASQAQTVKHFALIPRVTDTTKDWQRLFIIADRAAMIVCGCVRDAEVAKRGCLHALLTNLTANQELGFMCLDCLTQLAEALVSLAQTVQVSALCAQIVEASGRV
jgi:hypothetical protein